jgi:hypothetical protein
MSQMKSESGAAELAQVELRLVGAEEDDPERVAQLTYQLQQEVLEHDVEAVDVSSGGEAPPGTRGVEALAIGALIVQVSAAVLPAVLATVQAWISGLGSQKIRIKIGEDEIEVSGQMSETERSSLIKTFADQHARE